MELGWQQFKIQNSKLKNGLFSLENMVSSSTYAASYGRY
jgi:hypothetical protein